MFHKCMFSLGLKYFQLTFFFSRVSESICCSRLNDLNSGFLTSRVFRFTSQYTSEGLRKTRANCLASSDPPSVSTFLKATAISSVSELKTIMNLHYNYCRNY